MDINDRGCWRVVFRLFCSSAFGLHDASFLLSNFLARFPNLGPRIHRSGLDKSLHLTAKKGNSIFLRNMHPTGDRLRVQRYDFRGVDVQFEEDVDRFVVSTFGERVNCVQGTDEAYTLSLGNRFSSVRKQC